MTTTHACALAKPLLSGTLALAIASMLTPATVAQTNSYRVRNLVSDDDSFNPHTLDPNLINPWGLAASQTGPFWVANNGTGISTIYDRHGNKTALEVTLPSNNSDSGGKPTGMVFNPTTDFVITDGSASAPATFLFANEDGTISGWSADVPPSNPQNPSTQAQVAVDNSATGALYKGIALATFTFGNDTISRVYAANFHNASIDVFDEQFNAVQTPGGFVDNAIPNGYALFNITNINNNLYVTYAKQDANGEDEVAGAGRGFVDVFDTDGTLVKRLIKHGRLNAPWAVVMAPSNFGKFSNMLLVGNFGNGHINAYNPTTGKFRGTLRNVNGGAVHIDGLWGLSFGNGGEAGSHKALFFTAGPDDESHGLFGRILAVNSNSDEAD